MDSLPLNYHLHPIILHKAHLDEHICKWEYFKDVTL